MDTTEVASTTTTLTLVRHGQTHLNARRMLQGSCDSPLTRTGRAGVRLTAQHLAGETFHAAYSSPQGRAVLTAAELVREHPDLALRADDGLREFSFGSFERRPERELDAVQPWPELISQVLAGTHPGLPGGGESGAGFMARVQDTFARICAAHAGQHVLVVGHGLTLGAYLAMVDPRGLAALPNASVSRVAIRGGRPELVLVGHDVAGHGSVAARPAPASEPVPALV
ncbi:MAG: histidine phosphatase family protein [Cellulomonadaceae bacterium]